MSQKKSKRCKQFVQHTHTHTHNLRYKIGAGPRDCIGQEFAIRQLSIIFATLLLNFKIKLENPDIKFKYKQRFIMAYQNDMKVILEKRNHFQSK